MDLHLTDDYNAVDFSGLELLNLIISKGLDTKVIIYSGHMKDVRTIIQLYETGVVIGYYYKGDDPKKIIEKIKNFNQQ